MAKSTRPDRGSSPKLGSKKKSDRFGEDVQRLEKIFELMDKHQVAELEWEKSGERLKLKSRHARSHSPVSGELTLAHLARQERVTVIDSPSASSVHSLSSSSTVSSGTLASSSANPVPDANRKPVLSPFVGTFYRAPAPGADTYVKEGQVVKRGEVLCIIEAMKLMNEIEAEFSGRVVSVLVENGQPVEFGEPLFLVEPS